MTLQEIYEHDNASTWAAVWRDTSPSPLHDAAYRAYGIWKGDLRAATLDAEEDAATTGDPQTRVVAHLLRQAYEANLTTPDA